MGKITRYSNRNMIRWRSAPRIYAAIRAGRQVARSARVMANRSYTGTRTRKRMTSGKGVTTQHDRRFIYGKRRMPRYKRRRWKSFTKKVQAVSEKDLGSRTVVFNRLLTSTENTGVDINRNIAIYPQQSSESWLNDLNQIGQLENFNADQTYAAGNTITYSTKFLFKSAVLDVTYRNTSTVFDGSSNIPTGLAKQEVDVYEIYIRRECNEDTFSAVNLIDLFNQGDTRTQTITSGSGTSLNLASRGSTPWDIPTALGKWGIQIKKKTKFMVPNGDTFTYQVRDPKRRVCQYDSLRSEDGFNKPGWSKHLLFNVKLVPGLTQGTEVGQYTNRCDMGITRKYLYKIEGVNENRDIYFENT